MAVIFTDGFEAEVTPTARGWVKLGSLNGSIDSNVKRSGNFSYKIYCSSGLYWNGLEKTIDSSTNSLVLGFGIRFEAIVPDVGFIRISESDGSRTIKLKIDSSNHIYATNKGVGGSDALIGTSPNTVGTNTQYYLQLKVIFDPINGQVELLLGNQPQFNITSINTSSSNNTITTIQFVNHDGAYFRTYWIDDVYMLDQYPPTNDFLGVCSIVGSKPVANGSRMDFEVVGVTDHWDAVDETACDTSTYIYGDGLNEKAFFQMSDVTTAGDIKAVTLFDYAARSDEGQGISKYRMVLRHQNGTEFDNTEVELIDSNWKAHTFVFEKNPFTDSTWDSTTINNMQLGVKITQVD